MARDLPRHENGALSTWAGSLSQASRMAYFAIP